MNEWMKEGIKNLKINMYVGRKKGRILRPDQ